MKSNLLLFAFLLSVMLSLPPLTHAQDADKETDAALKQAAEAAKKMGMQMPDVKKIMEDDQKEEAKAKAKVQAVVSAPGPVAFPAWTPKVPQFTPSGPVARKLIDGKAKIALSGTSPLTPAELGDAWEATKLDNTISRGRNNSNINDTKTVIMYLSTQDAPPQEVRMEATRAPGEKITRVTITSPLPVAKSAGDDE